MTRRSGSAKTSVWKTKPRPNLIESHLSFGLQRQLNLQFYAFGFLDGNLSVPLHIRQSSREIEMLGKFLRDESGATAIEYSLIAGFIALAIIAAVGMTGQRLVALFESLIPALTLP
jgi:Flp pilus assembly pilin Flp